MIPRSKNKLMIGRRELLLGLGSLASVGPLTRCKSIRQSNSIQAIDDPKRDFAVAQGASLKERAAAKGLIYGAESRFPDLSSNPALGTRFAQECAMLVPGWGLKWFVSTPSSPPLCPHPHQFDFTAGDWMADFAKTHGLLFRGHTLIWHISLPPWFEETVNRQNAEQFLVRHIKTVAGRYVGQMHSWDVVNEAIATFQGRADGLRKTPWLKFLGPKYIDLAFRIAAVADPKAMLLYNEYGLSYDSSDEQAKRRAVLKLLEGLKSQGTPCHALGIQAHLRGNKRINPHSLRKFLRDVASMGFKILITELDVRDDKLPKDVTVRDRMVAQAYEDYLSVVLDEPAVIAVVTWGFSDRYTYLSSFHPRSDGAPVRPLPLDADFQPKLAWNAIARAFDNAPKR
ncbi:MAG: endo-1,4-beta-xylanase [Moorea sp. SIO1G6]|uniref:Beta-xylanase n=2 Tax=Coleofasciculaceae TaxID=1892251 RepID=F4XKE2_9CYAN|nr:beta-1,4-xylanase [Moorena producens 3L]NEP32515.1 endo-1,4-beta-xylanase [Moorena sp. SIO3B2]NEP64554.1 endo-1,4-beta-xylanase [Moorena sp. SIO3A5]NEQ13295.1 endo-1,4-beta-xylanase [Moorena sp. SIO3E2]NER87282.1 endo-1,4-beta-xylanase [Moorena sp. SIO3A2]NES41898.1 endo-1,4-beta-xylanase [Moorena sp. SIO2C4]NET64110.1 endo-1,4-beta-xylanase [Moorena sp. SIO1G6]